MNRTLGADRYKYGDWRNEKKGEFEGELGPRKLLFKHSLKNRRGLNLFNSWPNFFWKQDSAFTIYECTTCWTWYNAKDPTSTPMHVYFLDGISWCYHPQGWNYEWFSSNRIPMFCAQDSGIARGQTLRVATKKCMAWGCFCVKGSVFGHRMPHFAVILWETEVTNVGALKFQVSVWLMR